MKVGHEKSSASWLRNTAAADMDVLAPVPLAERELEAVAAGGSKPGVQIGDPFPKIKPKPN